MSVAVYTKSGAKTSSPAKLDKNIFGLEVKDHQLIKDAYLAYLANGRANLAKTKRRGEVRGGGRKPRVQKGTGRARAGSIRSPLWVGGGVMFGPLGKENYSRKINARAKKKALCQALSLAVDAGKIKVIEDFAAGDGKVKTTANFLTKIEASGPVLLVVGQKNDSLDRATRNIADLRVVQSTYLNVFDVLNSNNIVISREALDAIQKWLGEIK